MANPTGTTYLQANLSYTWSDGDIYQIPQTDTVEGAATGASFNGIGVENQPHQVILNKVQLTHTKQLVDETNIAIIQAFDALFVSSMGTSGYIKLGTTDVNLGLIQPIYMWGQVYLPTDLGSNPYTQPITVTFAWPLAGGFPHQVVKLTADFSYGSTSIPIKYAVVGPFLPLSKAGPNSLGITIDVSHFPSYTPIPPLIGWTAIGY